MSLLSVYHFLFRFMVESHYLCITFFTYKILTTTLLITLFACAGLESHHFVINGIQMYSSYIVQKLEKKHTDINNHASHWHQKFLSIFFTETPHDDGDIAMVLLSHHPFTVFFLSKMCSIAIEIGFTPFCVSVYVVSTILGFLIRVLESQN